MMLTRYAFTSDFARRYIAQGRLEGRQEGRQEGAKATAQTFVKRLLHQRYGAQAERFAPHLPQASADDLNWLFERIVDATDPQALLDAFLSRRAADG
jgi:hypothetical protein